MMTENLREVMARLHTLRERTESYDPMTRQGLMARQDIKFSVRIIEDLAEIALALLDPNSSRPYHITDVTDAGEDWLVGFNDGREIRAPRGEILVAKAKCQTPPIAGDYVVVWRNPKGRIYGVSLNDRLISYREDLK